MWRINFGERPESRRARRQRLQVKLDKIALGAFNPAYALSKPESLTTPLVLSSPHSGRTYPPEFLAQSTLSLSGLRQSEDCYIDSIIHPLTDFGVPVIAALFPRIYVDPNRNADEWPPESISHQSARIITPRARAGLGVVPTRINLDTDIYPHSINADLVQQRLDTLYFPYHRALADLITTAFERFGHALLIDCHSMPGHDITGTARADIVLGDCHGESCRPETTAYIESVFTELGYTVVRNYPYAGGYITAHYGKPETGIEAVQVEINKDLYLNPNTLEPHEGMAKLTANMQTALLRIKQYLDAPTALAAE